MTVRQQLTEPQLPEGFVSVKDEMPNINERVICFLSDGTQTRGYYYDNYWRSGWMTRCENGLDANQIWSGISVLGWKKQAKN